MAGRRSGASEEKEGERGLVHPQDGMLKLDDVRGRALPVAKVHITERAVIRTPLPPGRALHQHGALQVVDGEVPQLARPFRDRLHRRHDAQRRRPDPCATPFLLLAFPLGSACGCDRTRLIASNGTPFGASSA